MKRQVFFLSLFLSGIVLISLFLIRQNPLTKDSKSPVALDETITSSEKKTEYNVFGLDTRLAQTTHIIRRNESLSSILRQNGIEASLIRELGNESTDVFNVRRMRAGRPLHLFREKKTEEGLSSLLYVIYEENERDFIRFSLNDPVTVERSKKPVEVKTRLLSGEIQTSLYQTMRDIGAHSELTHRLADVFAWQVDFYRIQKGDHFTVLFEEDWVDGKSTNIGRIKSAFFHHRNKDYYAFHYNQNGLDEYFDEYGNSLRRQFMAAPLNYTRISSRFTNRRFHPVLQRNMPHHGTDYAAPVGTPVRAVGDGVVIAATYGRHNGNYIRIRHNSVYETGYLHLSRFARNIQPGKTVAQGEIIGYVGATGTATGPHLCFRFWKNGQPVDPQRIDLPPADPVHKDHRADFFLKKREYLTKLGKETEFTRQPPLHFALDYGYRGILSSPHQHNGSKDM